MSMGDFRIVGVVGSLRAASYNRALLRESVELAPPGTTVEVFEIETLPLYNVDLDRPGHEPEVVLRLRAAIAAADALLIVTPEHNWGPSGVTKNFVDWASRPAGSSVLRRKAVALMGASPGPYGTSRAQLQLRQNLQSIPAYVLVEPEVQLGQAAARFDDDLRLIDEEARALVSSQLAALREWAQVVPSLPGRTTPG